MSNVGKVNVYRCKAAHYLVTVDRDEGVTPAFIPCRQSGCRHPATSCQYQMIHESLKPTHEWYRADAKGGLLALREIGHE